VNISQGRGLRYVEVDGLAAANTFTIALGAPGWVDTVVSGSDVDFGAVAVVVLCNPTGVLSVGVRQLGSVQTLTVSTNIGTALVAKYGSHMEFYRGAAQIVYSFMGYYI